VSILIVSVRFTSSGNLSLAITASFNAASFFNLSTSIIPYHPIQLVGSKPELKSFYETFIGELYGPSYRSSWYRLLGFRRAQKREKEKGLRV
jgi:hypothetical protein